MSNFRYLKLCVNVFNLAHVKIFSAFVHLGIDGNTQFDEGGWCTVFLLWDSLNNEKCNWKINLLSLFNTLSEICLLDFKSANKNFF